MVDVGFQLLGRTHHKYILNPKHPFQNSVIFMALEYIFSVVLRTCPATVLVRMNLGWQILDSCFSCPMFLSKFPSHKAPRMNFRG